MHALVLVVLTMTKPPVAWTDRAGWPSPVSSPKDFDLASRAEVLVFVEALSALSAGDVAAAEVGLKQGDGRALEAWKQQRRVVVLENFRRAMGTCTGDEVLCPAKAPDSFQALATQATPMLESLPDTFAAWRAEARRFHALYVREQARLAMVSSRVSSEIALLDESEVTGERFGDRQFLLTFDDGPTGAGGETDALLPVLTAHGQHAVFFTVGDAVHARKTVKGLYDGHCLASHGASHQSHVTSASVAGRLDAWNAELGAIQPLRWFRPPYGQRTVAQVQALSKQGIGTMLWNIDSQDWQAPKDTSLVKGRVLTLMLLWRRGVVLFHDVHPVARDVLPGLVPQVGSAVQWVDCRVLE
jgi:peptidoglycan/xylan/chitin deacetylase (PgdA/CDA1 family)